MLQQPYIRLWTLHPTEVAEWFWALHAPGINNFVLCMYFLSIVSVT